MTAFTRAVPADAPVIARLRQRCWDAAYRGIYPDEMIDQFDFSWHAARDLQRIQAASHAVYLIREDDAPIGYLILAAGDEPCLQSLYLLPECQRRGVGRAALSLASAWCASLHRPYFLCQCHPENAPAMAFYRQLGGEIIAHEDCEESWQSSVTFRFHASPRRCGWCTVNPRCIAYHDHEWGVPCHDDRALFELLILESFQAGLSWECVLNKRDAFRTAFDGFDREKVAAYGPEKVEALMNNPGIIRNRRKIEAAIRNAQIFGAIQAEFGSFDAYLHHFAPDAPIRETGRTASPLSDMLSADLKRRGMSFVGSTIVYAFLQACGVLNGHEEGCDWHIPT